MRIRSPFNRNSAPVLPAGKPPKLRFQPGSFVSFKGKQCEVMYAYRLAEKPNEWFYGLAEREELKSQYPDMNVKDRIVFQPFYSAYQAANYFLWSSHENVSLASTKTILQFGGQVLPLTSLAERR